MKKKLIIVLMTAMFIVVTCVFVPPMLSKTGDGYQEETIYVDAYSANFKLSDQKAIRLYLYYENKLVDAVTFNRTEYFRAIVETLSKTKNNATWNKKDKSLSTGIIKIRE